MRNLMIITTSSKEILKTRNSFKNLKNREISWQGRRSGSWGRSFTGMVWRNGTHVSTSWVTVYGIRFNDCINLDDCRPIFMEFLTTSPFLHFSIRQLFQCRQKISSSKKTFAFQDWKVIISENICLTIQRCIQKPA